MQMYKQKLNHWRKALDLIGYSNLPRSPSKNLVSCLSSRIFTSSHKGDEGVGETILRYH